MDMITLRPVMESDQTILLEIYMSTRWDELAPTGWNDRTKIEFLAMQFDIQQRYYQNAFADAQFYLVEIGDVAAGRFYLGYLPDEIRIIDIALLPQFRGQGVGRCLLLHVQKRAAEREVGVSIHVEQSNPARALYERLGFLAQENKGFYTRMHWSPQVALPALDAKLTAPDHRVVRWVNTAS